MAPYFRGSPTGLMMSPPLITKASPAETVVTWVVWDVGDELRGDGGWLDGWLSGWVTGWLDGRVVGWVGCPLDVSAGPGKRHFVHRLVAFNTYPLRPHSGRTWGNPDSQPCDKEHETHHYYNRVNRRVPPWRNSRRENMVAWTKARHVDWHARNSDVRQMV